MDNHEMLCICSLPHFYFLVFVWFTGETTALLLNLARNDFSYFQPVKRDVTVINRNPGDPCPTVVDSNRQVGAHLLFGPRFVGDFYGQGQSQNSLQGFRSWGGGLGTPGVGLLRGFNLGVPIGSKVLNTDCNYAPQQAPMQTTSTRIINPNPTKVQNSDWRNVNDLPPQVPQQTVQNNPPPPSQTMNNLQQNTDWSHVSKQARSPFTNANYWNSDNNDGNDGKILVNRHAAQIGD